MSELDDIRARRAAITTGEWFPVSLAHIVGVLSSETGQPVATIDGGPRMNADATFIAAAPGDVDTLLAMVDALTGERAHLYEAGKDMQEQRDGWREEAEKARAERDALAAQLWQAQALLASLQDAVNEGWEVNIRPRHTDGTYFAQVRSSTIEATFIDALRGALTEQEVSA